MTTPHQLRHVAAPAPVVDDLPAEKSIELFGVDPVGSLNLSIQTWCGRFDVAVVDDLLGEVPVDRLPELFAVIGLDFIKLERQFRQVVVTELNRCILIVVRVGVQHTPSRTVVNGGVSVAMLLLVPLAEWFVELHINPRRMPWPLLLVTLPPADFALVSLQDR